MAQEQSQRGREHYAGAKEDGADEETAAKRDEETGEAVSGEAKRSGGVSGKSYKGGESSKDGASPTRSSGSGPDEEAGMFAEGRVYDTYRPGYDVPGIAGSRDAFLRGYGPPGGRFPGAMRMSPYLIFLGHLYIPVSVSL